MKLDLAGIFSTLHKLCHKDIIEEAVILGWFKTPYKTKNVGKIIFD